MAQNTLNIVDSSKYKEREEYPPSHPRGYLMNIKNVEGELITIINSDLFDFRGVLIKPRGEVPTGRQLENGGYEKMVHAIGKHHGGLRKVLGQMGYEPNNINFQTTIKKMEQRIGEDLGDYLRKNYAGNSPTELSLTLGESPYTIRKCLPLCQITPRTRIEAIRLANQKKTRTELHQENITIATQQAEEIREPEVLSMEERVKRLEKLKQKHGIWGISPEDLAELGYEYVFGRFGPSSRELILKRGSEEKPTYSKHFIPTYTRFW